MPSFTLDQALQFAVQQHQSGNLRDAENIYRQILSQIPDHPDALNLLGVLCGQKGELDTAISLLQKAVAAHPGQPAFHTNLGKLLMDKGRIDDAIACYRSSLIGLPRDATTHCNLGLALQLKGQLDEAHILFLKAIELDPNLAGAHYNLGNVYKLKSLIDDAIAAHQVALRLKPDFVDAFNNMGNAFREAGRLDEAMAAYRDAMRCSSNPAGAHSNLIFTQQFHPAFDTFALREEQNRWNQQHAQPLKRFILPHRNDRTADRPLRVGFVSPDFRTHCQSFFTIPLLSNLDRTRFHITCYSDVAHPDDISRRIQSLVQQWRNTRLLSDEALANLIRSDRIDILIDLTMHMGGGGENRLRTFARRPAPVQITWLAYPGSTGLDAIDFRLTDPHLDPPLPSAHGPAGGTNDTPLPSSPPSPATAPPYSERSLHLPDTFWCYDPLTASPEPNPLPALSAGTITFGCLNSYAKVNDQVLLLWSNILVSLPGSRLILLSPQGQHRQHALDLLGERDIAPDRIEFVPYQPRPDYLGVYHRIDIALETVPYNGHTTSLDAFWMGVPVVTLIGPTIVGRAGLSQLTNLGLPELIATTSEQYVQTVIALAQDLPRLSALRASLRQRMRASALMDAPRFTSHFQSLLRTAWTQWCTGAQAR